MAAYLVTGGCGFIGSHLSEALMKRGDEVRILDDLSTGSIYNVPPGAVVLRGDIANPEAVDMAMVGVEGCFHLAAIASVERSLHDWFGTHRTNLSGTIAVFDAARRRGQKGPIPVVYASSAAVYGASTDLPLRETTPVRPCSPYGADKYGCEVHARVASEVFGIPTVGLRFFNVYGPRQDARSSYSGVISIFCDRLRRGLPIDIFGDGSHTRDFVYIDDVVASLLAAMNAVTKDPMVFNVCSGISTSVLQLAGTIAELCRCVPEIRFQPLRSGEIAHSLGDRRLIGDGFAPSKPTDLRAGLGVTLGWMEAAASEPAVASGIA